MDFFAQFVAFIQRIIDSIRNLVKQIREHNDPKKPTEGTQPEVVA